MDRGRQNAVPPLVHLFLTKQASLSASTHRSNGRTRLPLLIKFREQLKGVFTMVPSPSCTDRRLSVQGNPCYSSLSPSLTLSIILYYISFVKVKKMWTEPENPIRSTKIIYQTEYAGNYISRSNLALNARMRS